MAEGAAALDRADDDRRLRRLRAIDDTAGALDGVYPTGYLEELRRDWPA